MSKIRDTLMELGYSPKVSGKFFIMPALYRGGDNPNALSINSETGSFVDFVSGSRGNWGEFLNLALNGNKELIKKYSEGDFSIRQTPREPSLIQIKQYDESMLEKLIPYYDFYIQRGISKETLKTFEMGLATAGKLNNRLVFPIRMPLERRIIGFAGRLIADHDFLPKWLIIGRKSHFAYPLHLTSPYITETRRVILVESIGDILSLYEAGIRNIACLFGLSLSKELLKQLISLNINHITLALNNDKEKDRNSGQEACDKLKQTLERFFDHVDSIIPPDGKNDWGACSVESIKGFFRG